MTSEFLVQVSFPKEEELNLIKKAVSVSSDSLSGFLRRCAKEKALEILKKWDMLPLDFYSKKEGVEEYGR